MATAARPHYITLDEYLTLDRQAEFKSEYLNGRIYAMAGASPEHNQIARNVLGELYLQSKNRPCEPLGSDMRVAAAGTDFCSYPDVLVVCGEMRFRDDKRDTLTNPVVIVEVLSDTTEAYDRGKKFAQYQRIESFTDYVLISQKEPRIEHFARQPDDRWLFTTATGLDAQIYLASIDATLHLSDVYSRVSFATE